MPAERRTNAVSERWIVIPKWDGREGFQHYNKRSPFWIKLYLRLLSDRAFLDLSMHVRGVLISIWLAYAAANRQLSGSPAALSRQLGQRVTERDLVSLNHAGFIQFSSSKPLATVYPKATTEKEKEKEPLKPPTGEEQKQAPKPVEIRCRYCSKEFKSTRVRGEHEERHRMYGDAPHTPIEEEVA